LLEVWQHPPHVAITIAATTTTTTTISTDDMNLLQVLLYAYF
jgi:hypothetical protein